MDRRKFIKTSMCLGCGAALVPAINSPLTQEYLARFSKDKFIYKRKEDLPKKIRLEVCSLCQLNCPRCSMRMAENRIVGGNGFGYLKFSNFKKLLDENPQLTDIEISNSGEIFLNPELDKIIEYAYKKNVSLRAFNGVNLNDLTDEMAECLVVNQFKQLFVSIDGATPETYKIYRVGGDLNKVFANIQKINKYKQKFNSKYPELVYKFILFGHNEHEIDLAREKSEELGMGIYFAQNFFPEYSPVKNKELVYKKTGINYDKNAFAREFVFCSQLFDEPTIDWNGNVLGCCLVVPEQIFDANVFRDGYLNAMNSKAIVESKHWLTNLSYKPQKDFKSPCLNCWYYNYKIKNHPNMLSEYV